MVEKGGSPQTQKAKEKGRKGLDSHQWISHQASFLTFPIPPKSTVLETKSLNTRALGTFKIQTITMI
jgi:hypothetical protein